MQTAAYDQSFITVTTPRGTVTIPKKLREKAGIKKQTALTTWYENGKIIFEPIVSDPYSIREYTDEEIAQFLEDDKLDPKLAKKLDKKFGFKPFSSSK